MMAIFRLGKFDLHGGEKSLWKIDCDALTVYDWQTLAWIAAELLPPFGAVEGVPQGGIRFADWLRNFVSNGPLLIVDDVLTTGGSMEHYRAGREEAIGCVVFARGPCPSWVTPLFQMPTNLPWLPPGFVRRTVSSTEQEQP